MTGITDKLGRQRSPATLPGFRKGQPNGNKGKRFHPVTYTPEECLMLIDGQSRTSASGLRHRAVIATLWRSGLRVQELLDLEIRDLNFGAASLHVRHGKGDKARTVYMDPFGWKHIAPWLAKRATLKGVNPDHGFVFCVTDGPTRGGPVGSPTIRTMLKHTAATAGLTIRVHPHGFRHTHACELFDEDRDMRAIQRQLGHSDLSVTSHYVNHLSTKAHSEAILTRASPLGDDVPTEVPDEFDPGSGE